MTTNPVQTFIHRNTVCGWTELTSMTEGEGGYARLVSTTVVADDGSIVDPVPANTFAAFLAYRERRDETM